MRQIWYAVVRANGENKQSWGQLEATEMIKVIKQLRNNRKDKIVGKGREEESCLEKETVMKEE